MTETTEVLVDAMEEQEQFVREFIETFKDCPMLWDSKNPDYKNRSIRNEAYERLLEKAREFMPQVQIDFVKMRLASLRSSFRREYAKWKAMPNHKPGLWYFDLLSFLLMDNEDEKKKVEMCGTSSTGKASESGKTGFWTREYSTLLIEIFKKYKPLYESKYVPHRYKQVRKEALKKVTEELMAKTTRVFKVTDVYKKIQMLRGQFRKELHKVKASEARGDDCPYRSPLWNYKLLSFLRNDSCMIDTNKHHSSSSDELKIEIEETGDESDPSDDDSNISESSKQAMCVSNLNGNEREDIYDVIARNVAHKMRTMTSTQRQIAQRVLNDLMYYGQMEQLSPKSRLSLDGQ